jgi:hypothetical protein
MRRGRHTLRILLSNSWNLHIVRRPIRLGLRPKVERRRHPSFEGRPAKKERPDARSDRSLCPTRKCCVACGINRGCMVEPFALAPHRSHSNCAKRRLTVTPWHSECCDTCIGNTGSYVRFTSLRILALSLRCVDPPLLNAQNLSAKLSSMRGVQDSLAGDKNVKTNL